MSTRTLVVFLMAIAVMVLAGGAFLNKMVEFMLTMNGDEIAGFGAAAIATYLAGMLPLLCLNLWAVLTGRFRDVEGPAQRMLDIHEALERGRDGSESHA
jgi:nitrogen fixation-related uncharacterized protein